ncbi:unnamed protein product [Microthlaspi erraticum]|uniref:Arabidopsis retrotransposon Orf1 C-terminal domain-containing protein n=1 Tax=Microthlaspi erraticum TaxID=1685480 RepID=A0A6D2L343_9BRAS|nr:unnamed protein product [Microthlaspi erraticum]
MHFRNSTSRSNKFKMLRGEGSQAAMGRKQRAEKARRMRERMSIDEGLEYVILREKRNEQIEESEAGEQAYSEEQSENERLREERRTKKRNDPISSESEQGEFEIGVNLVQEEDNGSPSEEGSDETESEEEGEEVNQEIEGSVHESNENVPMEEAESEEEDELPMYQEHYDALFSMGFVETKYPHDDTMRDLGIFEDVELVLKNMQLAKFFSYRLESYKELTCEFLASMRFTSIVSSIELSWTKAGDGLRSWQRGERKMVTFRQLEILFGFTYGEGNLWNIKEDELQRVWATIAEEGYSSSRSKAAQIRSPVLRYVHKALANTFFARKATGQSMKEK